MLSDHGYRWGADKVGAKVWTRLRVGEVDPSTGAMYGGPTQYELRSRDRIVVDEAGMVDLQTANVLVELAIEQGVGLAFVGDTHQALPGSGTRARWVLRSGTRTLRSSSTRCTGSAIPTTRRSHCGSGMRVTASVLVVSGELAERGHVARVDHHEAARERMIDAYFEWHARGGQQRILIGDTVQTRRNDRLTGVENRAQWIVRGVRDEYVSLVSVGDSGEVRRVSTEYARDHLQLAYASTVHGVQGDTADASVVGPDVDAAGLYVGLTRGRLSNVAIVVARTDAAAGECLAESMQRGTPEMTMQDAVRAAQAEVRRAARNREAAMVTGPLVGAPSAGRGMGI